MAIPSAELTLITGIQSDLASAKAIIAAAMTKAESLRVIANTAADAVGANHALASKTALDTALNAIKQAHVICTDRLLAQYGAANAGPVIFGGGAR